ncbi:hypothetical protein [Burkholderia gladioli]|uniref:hypothetical protein n=1 Tax=Burkholderia gladioli TaxID=28095 RepID=UPI00163EFC93|nr:hypothetical protein [Burkholderia gladioli]
MTETNVVRSNEFMDLLRHEQPSPFPQPEKPPVETGLAKAYDDAYVALRREFEADQFGRVSLKRIANLSR